MDRIRGILLMGLLFTLVLGGCASGRARPLPGAFYTGQAAGYAGPIRLSVQIEGNRILDILILDHEDDPAVGGAAMEALREAVLAANGTDIDGVSGATESSRGFLAAVDEALHKALLP
ncbi:MAG: FMN-binding protein [Treponema sp.]|jgi:fumarate reductase flavoprotein subunit|nr:FMN-binding protein [Treponema sp.]